MEAGRPPLEEIRKAFGDLFVALLEAGGKHTHLDNIESLVAIVQLFLSVIKGSTDSVDKISLALDEVKSLLSVLDTDAGLICLWQNFSTLLNKEGSPNG